MVKELKRLFERFDIDKSGTIDIDELGLMFETAGLIIDQKVLKSVFKQDLSFQNLELKTFAKLMTSRFVESRFKSLIKKIRDRYQSHDYSM